MSPERFERIEEIFNAAVALPESERDDFIVRECTDAAMLSELRSMLELESSGPTSFGDSAAELAAEMFSDSHEDELPEKINQYRIIRLLGMGGMGRVLLAEDEKLARRVALKILDGELASDAQRLNRFVREARAVSALNHPNILTVHEIGEFGDAHFIVTEFIDGETLNGYLRAERPELDRRLDVASQIASALAAAHDAGIVHRDIKPDNIMIRRDGIIKVLDFGIAKLVEESVQKGPVSDEDPTIVGIAGTIPGMIIGTPQYMSPEQARGAAVDARSDIFSFGVVLYEMITGKPPFQGETNMDVIGSILRDTPNPVRTLNGDIPEELERVIAKALRKDRDDRYQSIRDMLVDLKEVRRALAPGFAKLEGTGEIRSRTTAETTSGIGRERRFSLFHVGILALVAAAIGLVIWRYMPVTPTANIKSESPLKSIDVFTWASTPGESYNTGSFSPDGKMVAFASAKGGSRSIWIKQATSGEPLQVTKDGFDNEQPVWSPDGDEIAFFSTRGNQTGIWRTPILGGAPKFIATIEDGSLGIRFWSPRGLIYFESDSGLYAVEVSTGQIKTIADLGHRVGGATAINISRDEKSLIFVTTENERWNLNLRAVDGGEPRKLVTSDSEIKNAAFHTDGRRILYSQLTNGVFQTFVTDADGTSPRQITFGDRDSFVLDVSPEGSKILLGSAKEDSDIWRLDLKSGKETAFASDINFELWAAVSPDNKAVAYQSVRTLSQGNNLFNGKLLVRQLDSPGQPIEISPDGFLPVWSPDGQRIAFMELTGRVYRIATVASGGGQKTTVATGVTVPAYSILPYNRTHTTDFSWSPDGRRIAYRGMSDQSQNIFLAGFDGGEPTMLTSNDDPRTYYYSPLWSPDGRFVAATAKSNLPGQKAVYRLVIVDAETKIARIVTQSSAFFRLVGWEKTGAKLLIVMTEDSETSALHREVVISKVDAAGGSPQQIVRLKDAYLANIHCSPDGKSIAFGANRDGKDNVWLVSANGGEARQITENNDARMYFSSLAWSPDSGSVFYGKQSRFSLISMLTDFK